MYSMKRQDLNGDAPNEQQPAYNEQYHLDLEASLRNQIDGLLLENSDLRSQREAEMQRHIENQQQHDDEVVRNMLLNPFCDLPTSEAAHTFGQMAILLTGDARWQRVSPEIHRGIMEKARLQDSINSKLLEYMGKLMERPTPEAPKEQPMAAVQPQSCGEVTFCQRVKDIITKAATKNGQRMQSRAKGHERTYTFRIDAEAFCRAMDTLLREDAAMLEEFLGGTLCSTQVGKVCFFIGRVVEMHVINDDNLQLTDLLFAFEDCYPNLQTVKTKLSAKECSPSQKVLLGVFRGLLNRYKKRE